MRLFILCALVALASCRGCDDAATSIAPQIFVDACAERQQVVAGAAIGGVEDCQVDFGRQPISVAVARTVRITNPSRLPLTIESVVLEGDPALSVDVVPDVIAPGLSADIVVRARPLVESVATAEMRIDSDAGNAPSILVEISVTGVDDGVPDIELQPSACDFDAVGTGSVSQCNLTIKNVGARGLVLDSVAFSAPDGGDEPFVVPPGSALTPFGFSGQPPAPDDELAPGAFVVLPVRFTPDAVGEYASNIRLASNDPDETVVDVAVTGRAAPAPTCVICVKSVNGVPSEDATPQLEPLDDVIVSLDASTAGTTDGVIASRSWTISERPVDSQVELTDPAGTDTGFRFDEGTNLGVDLVGDYCVRASVVDDLGIASQDVCELCFEVIPKEELLVQLSWDTSVGDIDLHLIQQADDDRFCLSDLCVPGPWCDGGTGSVMADECDNDLDCNYEICRAGGPVFPEWDGAPGRTEGDPVLDIDDISGFGPENISVGVVTPGLYLLTVTGQTVPAVAGCTLRVFTYGRLAGELFHEVSQLQIWDAALLRWPDGVTSTEPCLVDLDPLAGTVDEQLAACDAAE